MNRVVGNERLAAALERARSGALVLPIWWTDRPGRCACPAGAECRSPGKHPLTPNGLDDASNNAGVITNWWRRWPLANLGERTDAVARIDIDLLEVAAALVDDVALPSETQVVRTRRGGLHLAVATPHPVDSSILYLDDGRKVGELKARRAYVLVPPSRIGDRSYTCVSPEHVEPLVSDDPVAWFQRLLEPFGFRLADGPRRRDYEALGGTIRDGEGRHLALTSYAGRIWIEGMAPEAFVGALRAVNEAQCHPPLPDDELVGIAEHFIKRRQPTALQGMARPDQDSMPRDGPERLAFPRTDAGNGELFSHLYGDRVRHDHRRNRWLVWGGHWWIDDADGEVRRLAKMAARHRYLHAATLEDLNERTGESKFAIQSENHQRLDAMLAQAKTEPPISDAGDRWDADPWLLAAANGVVDLRDGRLRPGRPEDRLIMHTTIAYDPEAACPRWLRFLDEVFGSDATLIDFIHRAVGYSLTGDTSEQCVFTCHGFGANGKSVFLTVSRALGGSYAYNAPFTTFETQQRASIPNDLAALAGRRLVTASETNENTQMNEARLKALTGGDPVTARFLHGEFFTYQPVAKYWLAVNHRPVVKDDSHGFWRRMRLIPFARRFTDDADRHLIDKLMAELPGILAWAVRGAVAWQEHGLDPPEVVVSETERYRTDSDPLGSFIEERCVVGERYTTGAAQAYHAYTRWAQDQGMTERERLTSTNFGRRMSARFEKRRTKTGKLYIGIGLLGDGLEPDGTRQPSVAEHLVTGLVTGFESSDRENDVSLLENCLTRENMEKPVTTRHPSPEDDRCAECGADMERFSADGVPHCGDHGPAEETRV